MYLNDLGLHLRQNEYLCYTIKVKVRHVIRVHRLTKFNVLNHRRMFDKYIVPVLDFRKKMCKEIVPTSTLNSVKNLCVLYDCLATVENGVGSFRNDNNDR